MSNSDKASISSPKNSTLTPWSEDEAMNMSTVSPLTRKSVRSGAVSLRL